MGYGNTEVYLTARQREELVQSLMGKTVTVEIDRPIGFVHHTKGVTLHYTVNYGFLPGVTGGDGEEQDVYVLGVDQPLERFTGRIIGAIRRSDDNEDKLVAAPEGVVLHQGEIAEAVHFVEQYFESTIDSLHRKSCGVIPYRKTQRGIELLRLLQRENGKWSFPKGHAEAGEAEQTTALRELKEETGLTTKLHPDFRAVTRHAMSPLMTKEIVLFLGEVTREPVIGDREIADYQWVTIEEAKFRTRSAGVIEQVEQYLKEKGLC